MIGKSANTPHHPHQRPTGRRLHHALSNLECLHRQLELPGLDMHHLPQGKWLRPLHQVGGSDGLRAGLVALDTATLHVTS